MTPIAPDETCPEGSRPAGRPDRLAWAIRVALAAYLAPAVAIVCAIGAGSILVEGAARVAGRIASRRRAAGPAAVVATYAGMKPARPRAGRRVRV